MSLIIAAAAGASLLPAAWSAGDPPSPNMAPGVTHPSKEAKLTFNGTGKVDNIAIKEGDHVRSGDLLLSEDARIEQKMLEQLEIDAKSTLAVEGEKAELAQKKVDLKRKQKIHDEGGANESEVEEAQLEVDIEAIKVKLEEEKLEQAKLKAGQQAIKVEQMKLTSPIDGVVKKIDIGLGEVVDPSKPYVAIVTNDPLWVELHLSSAQAAKLKVGDALPVSYLGEQDATAAKVIFLAPQTDEGTDLQLVRLEMPNPQGRASGLQALVKLPDSVVTAAAP